MGKQRRKRNTYHLEKSGDKGVFNESVWEWDGTTKAIEDPVPMEIPETLFFGMDFNVVDLNANLDSDARSVISISKRSCKTVTLGKKERRLMRHNTFIEKIQSFQERNKGKKKNKKKKKATVTPSKELVQLQDISPNVSAESSKKNTFPKVQKKKGILKAKDRTKQMLKDAEYLQNMWTRFKADPLSAVSDIGRKN